MSCSQVMQDARTPDGHGHVARKKDSFCLSEPQERDALASLKRNVVFKTRLHKSIIKIQR